MSRIYGDAHDQIQIHIYEDAHDQILIQGSISISVYHRCDHASGRARRESGHAPVWPASRRPHPCVACFAFSPAGRCSQPEQGTVRCVSCSRRGRSAVHLPFFSSPAGAHAVALSPSRHHNGNFAGPGWTICVCACLRGSVSS
jgi:hypothetical protein